MKQSLTSLAIVTAFVAIATSGSGQTNKVFRTFTDVPFETLNAERGEMDSLFVVTYSLLNGDSTVVRSGNVLIDSDDVDIRAWNDINLNSAGDIDIDAYDDVWVYAEDQFLVDVSGSDADFYIGVYSDIDDLEDDLWNDPTSYASDSNDGAIFLGSDHGDIILSVGAFDGEGDPGSAGIEMVEDDEEIHMYAGNGIFIRETDLWVDIPSFYLSELSNLPSGASLPDFVDMTKGRINLTEFAVLFTLMMSAPPQ